MLGVGSFPLGRWRVLLILTAVCIILLLSPKPQNLYDGRDFLGMDVSSIRTRLGAAGLGSSPDLSKFDAQTTSPEPGSGEAHAFWHAYAEVLTTSNLTFTMVREQVNLTGWPMIDFRSVTPWTSRIDRLEMTAEEVEEMRTKHSYVREKFQNMASGLPYVAGTRGVVMTTSVEAMGYFTVSLRMLRKTGTKLPVEIWIYGRDVFGMDPYGLQICEEVWKEWGATCKFVEDYLPKPRPPPLDIETYKYENKLGAMLFSSFEQFLFLDSDNFPVMPVDELFVTEPFISKGYVLWPDYWADTSSHYYYDIAGIRAEGLMDRATTESGQVMMNKRTHAAALLMASYYVRYGAQYYFQLFTQGAMGMGDKECYLKAAQVLGLPFYQVTERPERLGYRCNNEKPLASGQHHPGDDFILTTQRIRHDWRMDLLQQGEVPRIQFIHANVPRLDPPRYLDWGDPLWPDQHRCTNTSKAHRIYGHKRLTLLKFGWDVEKAIWDTMRWVACDGEKYMVQWWNGTTWNDFKPRLNTCADMVALYDEVFLEQEGLAYDPSLKSPFDSDGEFYTRLKSNRANGFSWENIRSPTRWAWALQHKDGWAEYQANDANQGYDV